MSSAIPDPVLGALRTEIVETEKLQTDTARWKLIAFAAIVSAAFGAFSAAPNTERYLELMFAVPAVCIFCDLTSSHLMMRILVIGAFLRSKGDPYETFCHRLRKGDLHRGDVPESLRSNPFSYELSSIFWTSAVLNFSLCLVGVFLPDPSKLGLNRAMILSGVGLPLISLVQCILLNRRIWELELTTRQKTPGTESSDAAITLADPRR